MTKPSFPLTLDATILRDFRSCPQKAFLAYWEHWKSKVPSIHLHAGAAYARGLEIARRSFYEQDLPEDEAQELGLKALSQAYGDFDSGREAKSLDRMLGALEYYFSEYPMSLDPAQPLKLADGSRAIEFSFALPLPIKHPLSGEPILYCGRTDMIVEWAGGTYVLDDKTTGSLGQSFASQWDLRSQLTGYCWACREIGIPADGAIIRGVSILKTKYETLPVVTPRSPFLIDRWLGQTLRDITRMIKCWEEGYWDWNLDESCSLYGGCQFKRICSSPSPDQWLPASFEQRIWEPLKRTETLIPIKEIN